MYNTQVKTIPGIENSQCKEPKARAPIPGSRRRGELAGVAGAEQSGRAEIGEAVGIGERRACLRPTEGLG